MISKENILAERSFKFINGIKDKDNAADIRTELEGLPAKIKINGLTQTLIYLLEKSKKDKNDNEQNDRYLLGIEIVEYLAGKQVSDHPKKAYELCKSNLRHTTVETTTYIAWLKRMSKALIEKKPTSSGGQNEDSHAS